VKKKLQKRVDSVGCLCYSKDKSFENQYPHISAERPEPPRRRDPEESVLQKPKKKVRKLKNAIFSLAFFGLSGYTSDVNNLLSALRTDILL
jgi:hypothetical protein